MATHRFMNSRGLLALLIVLCIANQYSTLQISQPASWRTLTSITADDGNTYYLYKPRCPALYRFGDVFVTYQSDAPPAGLLACVLPGSEATEANSYNFEDSTLGASIFDLYSDNSSLANSRTLGHASMETNIYQETFQGVASGPIMSNSTLTRYAVLTSDPCNMDLLPKCDTWSTFTVTVNTTYIGGYFNETAPDNSTIQVPIEMTNTTIYKYVFWNPMQKMYTMGSDFMLLIQYVGTEDMPVAFTPYCFTDACVCPTCSTTHGKCEARGGCICTDPQWTGVNCDEDVDECASNNTNNCATIATCVNQSPGYTCVCPNGYNTTDAGRTCTDFDECVAQPCKSKNQNCTNIPGSYVCTNCITGYIDIGNNGTCFSAADIYRCGNNVLDLSNNEQCDGGSGCLSNCKCDIGFSPQNSTSCSKNCGNGQLDVGEECDGGIGCINSTCVCNANLGYVTSGSLDCKRELVPADPCLTQSGNCTECTAAYCFYCPTDGTCSTNRIYTSCVAECPSDVVVVPIAPVAFQPEAPMTPVDNGTGIVGPNSGGDIVDPSADASVIVPAVVVPVTVVIAGVILLVFLLKRRKKKQRLSDQEIRLSASSRTSANSSRSKYGIDRTEIMTTPTKNWVPPPQSEFVLINKLPFDVSKRVDFNVGGNQYKVGQRYSEVIIVSAKDKKTSTLGGAIQFEFHPPSTPKATLEFNPPSGIIKKGKPVEIEVSLTVNMTCTIDLEYGIECPSERMHTFASVNVVSELSSFIDIEEVQLSGGASAKPVGDGAFGVVYKGKYRGQDVAVKMLKVQDMPEEMMLDEFDREVDLMNKLRHKNIVQFVGASKVVGKFALITEFIERGNLADMVFKHTNKPIDYGFKLKSALDTARAMLFLHENRVLHRDLKLDNLLVVSVLPDDPVCVKLTDFGSSRAVSEKIQNSYTSGIGTPIYMAPEILTKRPYDTKSDVYSFGVMLWILYTQKQPYTNFDHSWDVAQFVIEGNREKIPSNCPPDYRTLIELCWSQDPTERPTFHYIVEHLEKMFETNRATMPAQSNSKRKSTFLV